MTNSKKEKDSADPHPESIIKASKVQVYIKKNFKNNWANTKKVYTRPR